MNRRPLPFSHCGPFTPVIKRLPPTVGHKAKLMSNQDGPLNPPDSEYLTLLRLVAQHGTHRQSYALSVAFNSARWANQKYPQEFTRAFGTMGADVICDFLRPAP